MTLSPARRIRVLAVDDHLMVRRGLATLLTAFDDLELAGEAGSGEEAVRLCADLRPNVVLMDLVLPGIGGAAATQVIRQQFPEVQVIALTSFKDEHLILGALRAGAIGFLLKDVTAGELVQAIRAAFAGRGTLAPEATQALIRSATQPAAVGQDLTERERAVLALMVEGLSNTQIAARLTVSPSTIKSHVSNILAKLSVASRSEAVALAVRHHLIA